jgi:hypothetical protein
MGITQESSAFALTIGADFLIDSGNDFAGTVDLIDDTGDVGFIDDETLFSFEFNFISCVALE